MAFGKSLGLPHTSAAPRWGRHAGSSSRGAARVMAGRCVCRRRGRATETREAVKSRGGRTRQQFRGHRGPSFERVRQRRGCGWAAREATRLPGASRQLCDGGSGFGDAERVSPQRGSRYAAPAGRWPPQRVGRGVCSMYRLGHVRRSAGDRPVIGLSGGRPLVGHGVQAQADGRRIREDQQILRLLVIHGVHCF